MKVYSLVLVLSALLLTSCQRDELQGGSISGEEVTVSISAVVPGDGGAVVKSNDNPGNGSEVNRCILEVYLLEGEDGSATASLYGTRQVVKVENLTAAFEDLNLITGQKYRLVLWADHVDDPENGLGTDLYYDTENLPSVSYKSGTEYESNEDRRDAFFKVEEFELDGPEDRTVSLTRPFGQINIITTDYGLIPSTHPDLLPVRVKLAFPSIPTSIDLVNGTVNDMAKVITSTAVYIAGLDVDGEEDSKQLSFDYILAPAEGQTVVSEFTMSFLKEDGTTPVAKDYTFENIPVQRNYRTNVSGALLTDRAGLSIEVKPDFDGSDIPVDADAVYVTSIEEAKKALADGAESVTISQPVSGTIEIPATAQDVTLTLMGLSGDIMISGEEYSGMVTMNNLVQPENPVNLTINIPNGSFMLGRGTWSNVTVSTADNTFILGEEVTISGTLTVNKGNVEIYGRVENIEFKDDNSLVTVFTVYDAVSLKYAASLVAQNRCVKIVLGADIDLQGSAENPWEPIGSGLGDGVSSSFVFKEFDGNCKVISNLYVHNHKAISGKPGFHYAGLFYTFSGTIKDLTIKKAYVYGSRSSVLVGRFDGGIIENCNIYDSEVYGVQKNAMIAGFINNTALDVTIRGCVVRNGVIKTIPPADNGNATNFQSGGISGFLYSYNRNILIQDNVVDNISIPDADRTATGSSAECVSHDFVGNLLNNSSIDCSNYTVEFKNNKILNCNNDLPKNPVCTEFIGWYYSNALSPKIIVDGKQLNY